VATLATDPSIALSAVLGAVIAFALINWWEEAAWTGFALHRLQGRLGPVRASVVTTWMQAALHLPLVFIADGVTTGRVAPENIPFYLVALFVLPIPVRMTLTWIYNSSGRSVPIAGLYHAGLGVAAGAGFLPLIAPSVDPVMVYAGFAALAAIVLVGSRGRLGLPAGQTEAVVDREGVAVAA
jgi:membrane protease YdiL (CAAX protease family)